MNEIYKILDKLLPAKDRYDRDKKVVDKLTKEVKRMMQDSDISKLNYNGYNVSYSKRVKQEMNEAKVLKILKENNINAIKTVEVLDSDKLESMIYNGEISKDILKQLNLCTEEKVSYALTIKK